MSTIGHDRIREALEAELPPVALLLGPSSVGKRTLAQHVVAHHGITQLLEFYAGLSMDGAREVRTFLGESVDRRAVILRMDPLRPQISHLLLKVIEELPPDRHIIFLAERTPLATIMSRAWLYRCGYLSDAEMTQILFNLGMEPNAIPSLVARGRGQVQRALDSLDIEIEKAPITAILRATAAGDEVLFGKVVSRFKEEHLHLLRVWASEAATGMWRLFEPHESFGLEPYAQVVGHALESRARPRILVRAVLGRVMEVRK